MKSYSEMLKYDTFFDRFEYLKLNGGVGTETFGHDRYLNQSFYRSAQWKHVRNFVIARDLGCDLGISDRPINGRLLIHHINPLTLQDIRHASSNLLDPENLITTTHQTHNAIHYGSSSLLVPEYVPRQPGDTKPWFRKE